MAANELLHAKLSTFSATTWSRTLSSVFNLIWRNLTTAPTLPAYSSCVLRECPPRPVLHVTSFAKPRDDVHEMCLRRGRLRTSQLPGRLPQDGLFTGTVLLRFALLIFFKPIQDVETTNKVYFLVHYYKEIVAVMDAYGDDHSKHYYES